MKKEMVSVVIPTYGRPQYLVRAIKSVLRQTYRPIEIIVVDDNGENNEYAVETKTVIKEYISSNNIIYIQNVVNSGGSFTRNRGIEKAKGKYIVFLDDDDEMLPHKIEKQVLAFKSNTNEYGACFTRYITRKKNKEEVYIGKIDSEYQFKALCRNLYIGAGSNMMIRRDVIDRIGMFDESFIRNQDVEYLARISKEYKILLVDDIELIVHHDDKGDIKKKQFSYYEANKIDSFYLKKFKHYIEELDEKKRRKLYRYFALERFKRAVACREYKDGIITLVKNKVGVLLFIRYLLYLIDRGKNKTIYGFKL